MEKVRLIIHGRVQGVGFRFAAQQKATRLGLAGWVRNTPEGNVEIEAEGEKIQEFVKWCHKGPPSAKVTKVEVIETRTIVKLNYSTFEVCV